MYVQNVEGNKMKYDITFEIECGSKTCASKPGEFCRFLVMNVFGKERCFLFGRVFDTDGWIQRHKDCLKMSREKK